jgi:hypothetical protein
MLFLHYLMSTSGKLNAVLSNASLESLHPGAKVALELRWIETPKLREYCLFLTPHERSLFL